MRHSLLYVGVAGLQRLAGFGLTHPFPGQVIKWSARKGDSPMGHRTTRVDAGRLLEAIDGFLVIEAVTPDQASVEPDLSFGLDGRDRAGVPTEVKGIIHSLPVFKYLLEAAPSPARLFFPDIKSFACLTAQFALCNHPLQQFGRAELFGAQRLAKIFANRQAHV